MDRRTDRRMDRRTTARLYEPLLPEFFPVKLMGAFISIDFVVGSPFEGPPRSPRRHPARQALFDAGVALDTRVSPRRMLAWLRSMPSFRAGVQLRLGHDTDAGLAFGKAAELVELVGPGHPIVYLTRRPFGPVEQGWLAAPRPDLLVMPTATPRSASLGVRRDPLELVASAAGLDPQRLHWVVGPLASDGLDDARRVLAALPRGSRLTLEPLEPFAPPAPEAATPATPAALHDLESQAMALGHSVSEFYCREGLGRLGRGFFDVDRLTGQADQGRRALDLVTCAGCPSRTRCHGPLDEVTLLRRLEAALRDLGLTPRAPPVRTGPRAFTLDVAEPTSRGDETYLDHALGQPVSFTLSTRQRWTGAGGGRGVDGAVLRRWHGAGFLPVTELNAAAEKVLEDLRRRLGPRTPPALAGGAGDGGLAGLPGPVGPAGRTGARGAR